MAIFICIGADRKGKRRLYSKQSNALAENELTRRNDYKDAYKGNTINTSLKIANDQDAQMIAVDARE